MIDVYQKNGGIDSPVDVNERLYEQEISLLRPYRDFVLIKEGFLKCVDLCDIQDFQINMYDVTLWHDVIAALKAKWLFQSFYLEILRYLMTEKCINNSLEKMDTHYCIKCL